MKILALNPSPVMGGAELSLLDVLSGLVARGHSVLLAAPPGGPLLAEAAQRGVAVCPWTFPKTLSRLGRYSSKWALPLSVWSGFQSAFSLSQISRRFKPDVIYSNGVKSHFLSSCLRFTGTTPMVWHARDFVAHRSLSGILFRIARFSKPHIISNSQAVGREWKNAGIAVSVVHNGFSSEETATAVDSRMPLPPVQLMAAGILAPWKGFETILRACADLPARLDWHLTICGDELYETDGHSGERSRLETCARDLGIAERVTFTGRVRLLPYFLQSHIYIHGSVKPEPFGRVVAEAMLSGLPVIAPNAGGIPEFVCDGIDGCLYPMGNVRELCSSILQVAEDGELRTRLARSGRDRIIRDFSLASTVAKVEDALTRSCTVVK